ncbi:MAG: YetF domain-containing protein [Clostridioides difficile]
MKFRKVSIVLSGKPSILINKGEIDYKELKESKYKRTLEQLRIQGYFNIKYIQYAILEN